MKILRCEALVSLGSRGVWLKTWTMRGSPFVHASWGPQTATSAEEAVSTNGDGGVVRRGASAGAGGGSRKVAADHDLLLDHGLAAEHDVLGADQGSFTSYLVAGVLDASLGSVKPSLKTQDVGVKRDKPSRCILLWALASTCWAVGWRKNHLVRDLQCGVQLARWLW